jgi:hypothetical protein
VGTAASADCACCCFPFPLLFFGGGGKFSAGIGTLRSKYIGSYLIVESINYCMENTRLNSILSADFEVTSKQMCQFISDHF